MAGPGRGMLTLGVSAAVAAISSAALVILLAEPLDPLVIAAGRVGVTGLAMSAIAGRAAFAGWRAAASTPGLRWRMLLAAGLLALHFGTWIASLGLTTVVRSVTLVATQPLWAGLLGRVLGDHVPWRSYAAGAVAVVGTALMFVDDGQSVPWGAGDVLAIVAAIAAAGYLSVGRAVRDQLPLPAYLGTIHLLASGMLALIVVATATPWIPAGAQWTDALALLYLGLVPGVVGHGLLNWAVRHAPVHIVSLAIVVEPVGAAALAVAFLAKPVTLWEIVGSAVVLGGVAIGVTGRSRA